VRKWKPQAFAPRILLGNAVHEVLESLYRTRSVAAATSVATKHGVLKTPQWWRSTVAGYYKHYAAEIIGASDVLVEEEFRVSLDSGVDFGGRIDLVLEETVVDHKSTGIKVANRWARNRSWEQLYAYAFALTAQGRSITTLTYNVILAEARGSKRFLRVNRPVDARELEILPTRIQQCVERIQADFLWKMNTGGQCRACFFEPLCGRSMDCDASDEALSDAGFLPKTRQHEELNLSDTTP